MKYPPLPQYTSRMSHVLELSVPCSSISRARKQPSGSGPVRPTTFRWKVRLPLAYAIRQLNESRNNALDLHHHPPSNSRISAPSTLSHIHHHQLTNDPFDLPSWSFTSNHHPIQWHPLPLLRRRRAAISKMRNHAMPVRNGTSTYPSEGLLEAHLLVMRSSSPSPSPSPSHPTRRTTRDANICANHLDF
jgi:hypothetical protein